MRNMLVTQDIRIHKTDEIYQINDRIKSDGELLFRGLNRTEFRQFLKKGSVLLFALYILAQQKSNIHEKKYRKPEVTNRLET